MADVERLLSEFIAADRSGEDPDPAAYLGRARGTDRSELEALIDAYLAHAPRRAFDAAAFARSPARRVSDELARSLGGRSGLWPAVLPRLRDRARLKRADLVARLAAELGASGREAKVGAYYHAMEQGLLPGGGVSDRVLEALGMIVGESASVLREAGRALTGETGGPAPDAPVFARVAQPAPGYADGEEEALTAAELSVQTAGERDFVDELFTGASGAPR